MSQSPETPAEKSSDTSAEKTPPQAQLPPGPARNLALTATALAFLVYLLSFVGGSGDAFDLLTNPMQLLLGFLFHPLQLLLAGGLLAGAAALPKAGRVLVPAAVVVATGALMFTYLVIAAGGGPTTVILALVLAFLELAAVIGAVLLDTGIVKSPARRPAQPQPGYPQWGQGQPGYGQWSPSYGQQPYSGYPQQQQQQYGVTQPVYAPQPYAPVPPGYSYPVQPQATGPQPVVQQQPTQKLASEQKPSESAGGASTPSTPPATAGDGQEATGGSSSEEQTRYLPQQPPKESSS